MAEQVTTTVEPSTTTEVQTEVDVARGPLVTWTPEQRSHFRRTGETPEPPKKTEKPASSEKTSSATESSAETEGESEEVETEAAPEAAHKQEKPVKRATAEDRIKQLLARTRQLEADLEQARAPKTEKTAASSTAKPEPKEPQNYSEWRKAFKADKFIADWAKSNPEGSYEEAVAAMNDHMDEVRDGFRQRDASMREFQRKAEDNLKAARGRYEDFDNKAKAVAQAIHGDEKVPMMVKVMINDSEVFPDLLYTIGNKEGELDSFLEMARTNPGKALRYIALTESLIQEELEKSKEKPAKSETTEEPPAKPKTRASAVGAEVTGRSEAPGDAAEAAVQRNDFRTAKSEWNRKMLERLKK